VNDRGESLDKYGNVIDVSGYFTLEGEIQTMHQREKVYTKLLGERIVESYKKFNIVMSSHLVAFVAFRILLRNHPDLNLYDVMNLSVSTFEIDVDEFENAVKTIQKRIFELHKDGDILVSDMVKAPVEECIQDGIKNLGLYHPEKVLKITKENKVVSENFRLLYYYHNRLDSYGLEDYLPEVKKVLSNQE